VWSSLACSRVFACAVGRSTSNNRSLSCAPLTTVGQDFYWFVSFCYSLMLTRGTYLIISKTTRFIMAGFTCADPCQELKTQDAPTWIEVEREQSKPEKRNSYKRLQTKQTKNIGYRIHRGRRSSGGREGAGELEEHQCHGRNKELEELGEC